MNQFKTRNQKLYDVVWGKTESRKSYRVGKRTRIRLILKIIKGMKLYRTGKTVLDIGSGDGSLLSYFEKENVYAIEESEEGVKQIISRGLNRTNVFKGNIETGKGIPKKKFDLIICAAVLEHIEDDMKALGNIKSLMKNDSYLVIEVPYSMKYWTKFDELGGHKRRYTEDELRSKLSTAGLKTIFTRKWGFPFYRAYNWFYTKTNPDARFDRVKKSSLHTLLYHIFKIDDLFAFDGNELFTVATKV